MRPADFFKRINRLRRKWWSVPPLVLIAVAALLVSFWDTAGMLGRVGRWAGYDLRIGGFDWESPTSIVIRNIKVDDFAEVDLIDIEWTWSGLARREIETVRVFGPRIWMGKMLEAVDAKSHGKGPEHSGGLPFSFTLNNLVIGQGVLVMDNLGPGLPPIPLRVGEEEPLLFENLKLGLAHDDPAAREIQTAKIFDVIISSPYDPLTSVLKFEEIEVAFSWAGIQEHHLDKLAVNGLAIYVGEHLFWFMDKVDRADAKAEAEGEKPTPWTIANFDLNGGRIILAPQGGEGLMLPFVFGARRAGLVLEDFNDLPFDQIGFTIPETDLYYPDLDLRVDDMKGELYVSLPPQDESANDLVPAIKIKKVTWKGLEASDITVDMTFNRQGIYANVKGATQGGFWGADVLIRLDDEFSWLASAWSSGVDVYPITRMLTPENIVIEGKVDGKIIVRGQSKVITGLGGEVSLRDHGKMTITAVDDMVKRLPDDWNPLKREMSRISLEAFRDYDYTKGTCEFTYAPPESFVRLSLDGLQGQRNFDIRWHDKRETPGFGF